MVIVFPSQGAAYQLSKMIKQRIETAKVYEKAGRNELADTEKKEIDIINDYVANNYQLNKNSKNG